MIDSQMVAEVTAAAPVREKSRLVEFAARSESN